MDDLLNKPLTDEQVEQFSDDIDTLEDDVLGLLSSISFELEGYENLNSKIDELTKRLVNLSNNSKEIIKNVDRLVDAPFDKMEIESRMDALRENIFELKRKQIDKYNAMAEMYNIRLSQIKGTSNIPEDAMNELNRLGNVEKYNGDIQNYMQNNYMGLLRYDVLINNIKKLIDIANKLGMRFNYIRDFNEIELNSILKRTNLIDVEIKDMENRTDEEVDLTYKKIKDALIDVDDLQILVKDECYKEKISKDDENNLLSRLNNVRNTLNRYLLGGE